MAEEEKLFYFECFAMVGEAWVCNVGMLSLEDFFFFDMQDLNKDEGGEYEINDKKYVHTYVKKDDFIYIFFQFPYDKLHAPTHVK